jgi:tetratricopeptide (TPR) repeat protein
MGPEMFRDRIAQLGIALVLVALTLSVFAGVRDHEFVDLDDLGGIQGNPDLEADSLGGAFRNAFTKPLLSNWIPITSLSHQLDRRLYGPEGAGHLLTNVAIHAGSTVLLFLALSSLTGARARSAFVAAVFAVHPLHVETVVWISERKGVLSGFFCVLTLLAHARQVAQPSAARRAGVLGALLLALLSKPTAVTLPCVLLLLDFWPLRRLSWGALWEKLPMFALVAAVAGVTFFVQRSSGAMAFGETLPFATRLANAAAAYGLYLEKAFWPVDLSAFYPYPRGGPNGVASAGVAAALAAATLACLWLRTSRPFLLMGWLWFGGMLVPTLGLVQVGEQSYADRYMYLPLVGLAIGSTWGVAELARSASARRVVATVAITAIAVLSLMAREQTRHWRDSFALWERVLEVTPNEPRALIGIGGLHGRRMELAETERYYIAAYQSDPERPQTREALRRYFTTKSAYLARRGEAAGALESLEQAVRYDPAHPGANASLGLALARRGQLERARDHLARGYGVGPDDLRVLQALAGGAEASGRFEEALALRREILRVAPQQRANVNDLAWLLATAPSGARRDPDQAVALAEGLALAGESPAANELDTLAAAYAAAGRFDEAIASARRAIAMARAAGELELAAGFEARLTDYLAGRAHIQPDPRPDRVR